jgi:hypothetical protein
MCFSLTYWSRFGPPAPAMLYIYVPACLDSAGFTTAGARSFPDSWGRAFFYSRTKGAFGPTESCIRYFWLRWGIFAATSAPTCERSCSTQKTYRPPPPKERGLFLCATPKARASCSNDAASRNSQLTSASPRARITASRRINAVLSRSRNASTDPITGFVRLCK